MDLQTRATNSGHDVTEQNTNLGCDVDAILDNSCSSSESLLHSTSESPPLLEDQDNIESVSDGGQVVQHWSYEEQFRQV